MTKFICVLGTLFTASLLTTAAAAADAAAGKAKAQMACQTCHGMDGVATMAMTPNLSGQREEYLVIQLRNFRAAKRQHEQMTIIAKMLSDDDIDNVSAWYANIKITIQSPE